MYNKFLTAILIFMMSVLYLNAYTIRFSHVVSPKSPKGKAALYFKQRVEKLTDGNVIVKVYPNSQLFTDSKVLKAMKEGKLEMAVPSLSKIASLAPQIQIFDLPFLFDDMNHVHRVMKGKVGNLIKKLVTKKGYIAFNFWDNGFKHLSSSYRPLFTPADAKNQKFRIMNSRVLKEQFEALGATAKVLPFSKVYNALKTKEVDAAENPLSNFYTKKFYEVQNSLVLTSHGYLGYLFLMDKKFWDKLPQKYQKAVKKAAGEATLYERKLAKEMESVYLSKLEEYAKSHTNFNVLKLLPNERNVWKREISIIYPKFYPEIGLDLIDEVEKSRNR